jgi:hypothetical protein
MAFNNSAMPQRLASPRYLSTKDNSAGVRRKCSANSSCEYAEQKIGYDPFTNSSLNQQEFRFSKCTEPAVFYQSRSCSSGWGGQFIRDLRRPEWKTEILCVLSQLALCSPSWKWRLLLVTALEIVLVDATPGSFQNSIQWVPIFQVSLQ